MPRHGNPDESSSAPYLEVPMVVYSAGRRVRVGIASVFRDGIAAHFDEKPDDDFAKAVIKAITEGAVNALSIAPTPEKDPSLADYIKERE